MSDVVLLVLEVCLMFPGTNACRFRVFWILTERIHELGFSFCIFCTCCIKHNHMDA